MLQIEVIQDGIKVFDDEAFLWCCSPNDNIPSLFSLNNHTKAQLLSNEQAGIAVT